MMMSSGVTVVMGGQWGDEGKGKLVDVLAVEADFVCRCQVCVGVQYMRVPKTCDLYTCI